MTLRDIGFFVAAFCISLVIGSLLAILCRGCVGLTVISSAVVSFVLFVTLESRFGSSDEWSWQYPVTSSAYLYGPFLILVLAPTVGAALFVSRWVMRRKVI